jgi:hypothetical protein
MGILSKSISNFDKNNRIISFAYVYEILLPKSVDKVKSDL